MRGDNWDGTPVDTSTTIRPVVDAMLAKQDELRISMKELSRRVGACSSWQGEFIAHLKNPRLGRFCRWAQQIEVQELGVFLILGEEYTTYPLYDVDLPIHWVINENGRQVPDFREPLKPLVYKLKMRRRGMARTAEEFTRGMAFTRNVLSALESGEKTRSPTAGHLATWADHLGAQAFGVYVVIDGTYTEADLLGEPDE